MPTSAFVSLPLLEPTSYHNHPMTTVTALRESDIIFPLATHDIKNALTELKRSNLSISNRLRSIKQDAEFVKGVTEAYALPLVANERCGSWYIDPTDKAGSAYFKSTDGHFGQWSFSLRRLNLQVLNVIQQYGGYGLCKSLIEVSESVFADVCYFYVYRCIIVDSTRRGKRMPDALSKTIPIWICVLNRLLFPKSLHSHHLCTPPQVVSASEHAQIQERVPSMVDAVRSLNLDVDSMRIKLGERPMQPVWVTPGSSIESQPRNKFDDCHAIVLCTASSRDSEDAHDGRQAEYVQGAADDHESWACGLDAVTFWHHQQMLLATPEDELPSLIEDLVVMPTSKPSARQPILVKPTTTLWIANNSAAEQLHRDYDVVITCDTSPSTSLAEAMKSRYIQLACSTGKNGSRQLRTELSKLSALDDIFANTSGQKILVTCQTGKDLAVGAALAVICRFVGGDGSLRSDRSVAGVLNKDAIKQRLSWIMVSLPDASPSRATLQSVNAFLLS
ncbi:tRNA a64-2'-o-ribosylphosphate transferase [Teratosphaeria destructans]|uniref:tRNA a64-2'-o-ribosylphosphate transferase n=1 Tax=Teratosphaeria destructans TaxID=418781 RepID=A0A9W7W1Z0_9PEZI|nr:tRNA a64-2'-o-ribosylphosphate transferase [Teratosphaeria destructans]